MTGRNWGGARGIWAGRAVIIAIACAGVGAGAPPAGGGGDPRALTEKVGNAKLEVADRVAAAVALGEMGAVAKTAGPALCRLIADPKVGPRAELAPVFVKVGATAIKGVPEAARAYMATDAGALPMAWAEWSDFLVGLGADGQQVSIDMLDSDSPSAGRAAARALAVTAGRNGDAAQAKRLSLAGAKLLGGWRRAHAIAGTRVAWASPGDVQPEDAQWYGSLASAATSCGPKVSEFVAKGAMAELTREQSDAAALKAAIDEVATGMQANGGGQGNNGNTGGQGGANTGNGNGAGGNPPGTMPPGSGVPGGVPGSGRGGRGFPPGVGGPGGGVPRPPRVQINTVGRQAVCFGGGAIAPLLDLVKPGSPSTGRALRAVLAILNGGDAPRGSDAAVVRRRVIAGYAPLPLPLDVRNKAAFSKAAPVLGKLASDSADTSGMREMAIEILARVAPDSPPVAAALLAAVGGTPKELAAVVGDGLGRCDAGTRAKLEHTGGEAALG